MNIKGIKYEDLIEEFTENDLFDTIINHAQEIPASKITNLYFDQIYSYISTKYSSKNLPTHVIKQITNTLLEDDLIPYITYHQDILSKYEAVIKKTLPSLITLSGCSCFLKFHLYCRPLL